MKHEIEGGAQKHEAASLSRLIFRPAFSEADFLGERRRLGRRPQRTVAEAPPISSKFRLKRELNSGKAVPRDTNL